jgi:hypothetical protein
MIGRRVAVGALVLAAGFAGTACTSQDATGPSSSPSESAPPTATESPIPVTPSVAYPLPDRTLTPGETFPNATKADVCTPGWAGAHRNVTTATRRKVYAEYGATNVPGMFEVDHLISLELGGNNSIRNLWPELNDHPPGALNTKDLLENRLHKLVCAGTLDLHAAQVAIAIDWVAAYRIYG